MSTQTYQRTIVSSSYWAASFVEGAARIIIPLYFAAQQITITQISIMFLFYEGFGLLANFYSGVICNRLGYKTAFLISLFLHTVASVGYLFISSGQLGWTLLCVSLLRACRGTAKELIKTTSSAYFKHYIYKRRSISRSLLLGGKDTAKGLGILLGGILLSLVSFQHTFLLLGSITGVFLFISWLYIPNYKDTYHVSFTDYFHVKPKLILLGVTRALLYLGRDVWIVIAIPIYLLQGGMAPTLIAFIIALGFILFGITQPIASWFNHLQITLFGYQLKKRWQNNHCLSYAGFIMAGLMALLSQATAYTQVIVISIIIYNILAGFATAPHNHLHIKYARGKRASIDISAYKGIAQSGKFAAFIITGLLYKTYGIQGCLIFSSLILFLSALINLLFLYNIER